METTLDLNLLCQRAIHAAREAGSIIDQYREQDVSVERKATGDSEASQVVTEVDRKAQRAIIEILEPTLDQYDLALLAEESADDDMRLEKPAFWAIDPMDGTLAFVRNVAGFSVSIALVSKAGDPLLGVVYDPLNQDCYHAIKGAGAFKNNQVITPAPLNQNAPLVLCTDISFKNHQDLQKTQEGLEKIAAALGLAGATIEFRIGAVMNAISTLENPNYCYFKFARSDNGGGSIWDYAATACIYQEVNAIACDIYGNPMELNRPGSTFMNHKGILYSPSRDLVDAIIQFNLEVETL